MFDILIIGAGPTGLVSALTFAKAGYEVAVVDPVNRAGAAATKYSDRSPDLRTTAHLIPTVKFLKNFIVNFLNFYSRIFSLNYYFLVKWLDFHRNLLIFLEIV